MLKEKDFTDIGINLLPARVLCNHVAKWKVDGLLVNFRIVERNNCDQFKLGMIYEYSIGVAKNAQEAQTRSRSEQRRGSIQTRFVL